MDIDPPPESSLEYWLSRMMYIAAGSIAAIAFATIPFVVTGGHPQLLVGILYLICALFVSALIAELIVFILRWSRKIQAWSGEPKE